jgi:hypothetical protein
MRRSHLLAASIATAAFGCMVEFDPSSRVNSLRILAIQADLPYAQPGETVKLTALAVDAEGRPFNWAYSTCTLPRDPAARACVKSPDPRPLGVTDGTSALALQQGAIQVSLPVGKDVLTQLPLDARIGAAVGVNIAVCIGELRSEIGAGGLPIGCRRNDGSLASLPEYDIGTKRIFIRTTDRNQNPAIQQLTWDGAVWDESDVKQLNACASSTELNFSKCDGPAARIAIRATGASFENGTTEFGDTFAEQLVAQYYATDGIFEYDTRVAELPGTQFKARAGSIGKTINVYFVLRDDRGGVTWAQRKVLVK